MSKATQPTPAQILVAVRRGALWLSKQNRRWYETIDVEQINLGDSLRLPATLALGRKSTWDEDMTMDRAVWLGLVFPKATPATIELANKFWKAEVRSRSAKASATSVRRSRVSAA
jgi:hypothetical protein